MSMMRCELCDKYVDTDYVEDFVFCKNSCGPWGGGICEACFEKYLEEPDDYENIALFLYENEADKVFECVKH